MIKIIVVDDETAIREGIVQILEERLSDVAEIISAEDGEVAYEIIVEDSIDLVITDVNMPILNGIDMMKAVSRSNCDCHVIVISGYKQFEFAREALKLGAIDYLLKPIDENDLISVVQKAITAITAGRDQQRASEDVRKRIMQLENDFFVSYIINLLYGFGGNEPRNTKTNPKLDKLTGAKEFQIVVCSFEDYDSFDEYYDDISECYLADIRKNECVVVKGEKQIIILFYLSAITSDIYEKTKRPDFLYLHFNEKYNKRINIGISEKVRDLNMIRKAYNDAEIASIFNYYHKSDRASYFEDICKECVDLTREADQKARFWDLAVSGTPKQTDDIMIETIRTSIGPDQDAILFGIKAYFVNIITYGRERGHFTSVIPEDQLDYRLEKIKESVNVFEVFNTVKEFLLIINRALDPSDLRLERKIIKEAKQYISDNLCKELSLEQVAKEFYFSPNYFSSLFAKSVGQTFTQYLIQERIALAKRLLNDPKIKIYEISGMVGYKEPRNFMRIFKANTGMTMSRFREGSLGR